MVVNVAGAIRYASVLDQEERDFDDIVNVNLSTFLAAGPRAGWWRAAAGR